MRGKKTTIKDKQKVITAKLLNPEKSLRDIEKETNIPHSTVKDVLDEIPWLCTTSDNWAKLIDTMDKIINDIANMTALSMDTFADKIKNKELWVNDVKSLNDIAKNNFDRKQILTWWVTWRIWIENDYKNKTTEELIKMKEWIKE